MRLACCSSVSAPGAVAVDEAGAGEVDVVVSAPGLRGGSGWPPLLRKMFADVLDSPAGQAAQIRAAAALLHRADEHPDLVPPLHWHVRPLLDEIHAAATRP